MTDNNCNILIVEDEWINAEFLSDIIHSLGYSVVGIAKSAKETLDILRSKTCDLIFMDINIKGSIDGIQLAQQLNEKRNIPVIFITAFGDSDTIADASKTNIYGFVIKPFNHSQIEAVLSVAIAKIKKEGQQIKKTTLLDNSKLDLGNGYIYDFQRETMYFKKTPIYLSKNESTLLLILCSNYGHIISSEEIRAKIWGEKNVTDSTLRDTICRVRKKISFLRLENFAGIGYSLIKEKN